MKQKLTKVECGKMGDLATYKKHGTEHMQSIGKRGAESFHNRYDLKPVNLNDFAIVEKTTGKIINFLSGARS